MVLELKLGLAKESLFVVNVYNVPTECERAGRSADILMDVPEILQKHLMIIGDINLHHTDWNNRTIHPTLQAQKFVEWISDSNGDQKLEPGSVTYTKGGTPDLVISSSSISKQIIESYVEPRFHVTSDHETILTWLELDKPFLRKIHQEKFRLDKMDEKKLLMNLEAQKDLIQAALAPAHTHAPGSIKKSLDKSAKAITGAIYTSLSYLRRDQRCLEKGSLGGMRTAGPVYKKCAKLKNI